VLLAQELVPVGDSPAGPGDGKFAAEAVQWPLDIFT
jgi:hypothetical protein